MLGLQGNTSPTKEYQCVACSATFTGLASLLVHQANHVGPLSMPAQRPPDPKLVEAPPTLKTEENKVSLPTHSTTLGEEKSMKELTAFSDTMDTKQSHTSEVQSPQSDDHELAKEEGSSNDDFDMTIAQTVVCEEDSNAGPSGYDSSTVKNCPAAIYLEVEESAAVASAESQSPVSAKTDEEEQCDEKPAIEEMTEETEGNDMDENGSKNRTLMKSLASAYGKQLVSPPSVDDNLVISLKEEPELVVITPQTTKESSKDTGMPALQLKRIIGKTGMKTKAPSISRLLEASTKKIVSLTKIFSPVVVLETRQRFMDPNGDTYGKYQCSRCRKIFQDVDSLTEHHFMHKKERIKCCRCCKQLIIGRIPLPDNHVCPRSGEKATVSTVSSKGNASNTQKIVQINPKKVFFCPVCRHNFSRRSSLKMHKCGSLLSTQSQQAKSSVSAVRKDVSSKSIGVVTENRNIKVEDDEHLQESQWTVPLNNETEMLSIKNNELKGSRLRPTTVLRDGLKQYSCEKCHKTFGLSSNLCRHRKVCCIKPKGLGTRYSPHNIPLNASVPLFPCYVCGKNFNRKDNMITHRKKCEQRRTMIPNLASEINQSLLPSDETLDQTEEEDEGNWSIMSLPSVLPRRVTCECGLGFTSPKLLLEHLQKHVQESYICPTCGMTVKSWIEYETHLQLHMHPLHHKRSQPLLLQFKKDMCVIASPEQASHSQNRVKNQSRKQPFECPKCRNSFSSRCTLLRHLTWSQCRGDGANTMNYNLF